MPDAPVTTPQIINVIDQGGELRGVPEQHLNDVLRSGAFRVATPQEIKAYWNEQDHGGAVEGLKAFGEGAASALTFGLAPHVEEALGVAPEDIAGRKEAHPIAHGAGEVAGVVAPLALTAGAAAPAEGAALAAGEGAAAAARAAPGVLDAVRAGAGLTAPGLIARAGTAVRGAVEGAELPGVLGRLAPAAAQGAAEGALYGGSDVVERELLGDPALTAESAAREIGFGALFGGGLMGAGKALSEAIPTNLGEKATDWLGKTAANRNAKAAGAIQSDLNRALKTRSQEALDAIHEELGQRGLVGPLTTPKDTLERAKDLIAAGKKEAGDLTAAADAVPDAPRWTFDQIRSEIEPEILEGLKSKGSTVKVAEQVQAKLDDFSQAYAGRTLGVSDLHALRTDVDQVVYNFNRSLDPFTKPAAAPLKKVRDFLADTIEQAMDDTGIGADAWREAMRKQEVGIVAKTYARRGMLRAHGNNAISLTELMSGLTGAASGGPLAGIASAAGAALVRRHGSGTMGWVAGALKNALERDGGELEELAARAGGRGGAGGGPLGGGGGGGGIGPAAGGPGGGAAATVGGQRATRIITPQHPAGEPAHYAVMEADQLIPSHKPTSFKPHPDYPEGVQERQYHLQPDEQLKVSVGGKELKLPLVLTDSPTAVDGPPIVAAGTPYVLGGNGRTMMIQRAFRDEAQRDAYKAALEAKAPAFGIDPAEVSGLKSPVLVRVATGVPSSGTKAQLASAVRRYNEGMTQGLSPAARAVAEARNLSPETMDTLGGILSSGEDKSLRDLMRERPGEFVQALESSGVITRHNRPQWVAGSELTDEAKDRIEGMFVGRVVGTGDRYAAAPKALLQKVENATPHLLRVAAANPEADEIGTVRAAIDLLSDAKKRNLTLSDALAQKPLFGDEEHNLAAEALATFLDKHTPREVGARFGEWAQLAGQDPRQASLFGPGPTPEDARRVLFNGVVPADADLSAWPKGAAGEAEAPAAAPTGAQQALLKMRDQTSRDLAKGARAILEGGAEAPKSQRTVTPETYPHVAADLGRYGGDLDALADTVSRETEGVAAHAPATADALHALAARGVQHLQALLPQGPAPLPLTPEYRPSVAELAPFNRAAEIAGDPLRVLGHLARGTLDPVHVKTVEVMWPSLAQEMRVKVLEGIAAHKAAGKVVPRQVRLSLSMFLGQDLDRSTTQATIAANQAAFAAAPKPQAPGAIGQGDGGGKGGGKASGIKAPGRLATASQRLLERDVG